MGARRGLGSRSRRGGGHLDGDLRRPPPGHGRHRDARSVPRPPGAVGSAEVDEDKTGARTLTVSLAGEDGSDDYREVWLIRNDGKALISLGVLDAERGVFAIPENVDLDDYDLVDISFEPIDGDPTHSGNSIVRGTLDFT